VHRGKAARAHILKQYVSNALLGNFEY